LPDFKIPVEFELSKNQLINSLKLRIGDRHVIDVMARVPRHRFVPENCFDSAYNDRPLSIGYNQTISQPYIVALMTEALELKKSDKVLELGTGSGYQTAILAELAGYVISVERIPQLITSAKKILFDELGYKNIELYHSKKKLGWIEGQPYDAIIVTAAAPNIPKVLIDQLKLAGRMVIPIGTQLEQNLIKLTKFEDYNVIDNLGGCRFVPLIGEESWNESRLES
jgi:protein-L-isoaspartate(D-aspartate) O-methyltransferase